MRVAAAEGQGREGQAQWDEAHVTGGLGHAQAHGPEDIGARRSAPEDVGEEEEQQVRRRQRGLAEGLVRDPGTVALRGQLRRGDDLAGGQGQAAGQRGRAGRDVASAPRGRGARHREEEDVQAGGKERVRRDLRMAREDLHGQGDSGAGHVRPSRLPPQPLREEHDQREPGRGVDDRGVAQMRNHEAGGAVGDPRDEGAERRRADGARVEPGVKRGQDVAGERDQVHGPGSGQQQEEDVGRIEGAGLDVRQEREAAEEVRVPERQVAVAQDLGHVDPHRVVIEDAVAGRREHPPGQERRREEGGRQQGQRRGHAREGKATGRGRRHAPEYSQGRLDFSPPSIHPLAGPRC